VRVDTGESKATGVDARPPVNGKIRAKWMALIGALVLLLALGGWAVSQYFGPPGPAISRALSYFRGSPLPAGFASGNGRIEATEYDIATKRAGRLVAVLVAEGDMVDAGQVIARMDTKDLEAELRGAEARSRQAREDKRHAVAVIAQRESDVRRTDAAIAQRQSDLGQAEAAIAQRESDVNRAAAAISQRESAIHSAIAAVAHRESEMALAKKELERAQELFAKDLIARQQLDEALSRHQIADAVLAQERAARQTADASLVEAQAQRQSAAGAVNAARAQRDAARAALAQERAQKQAAEAALTAARIDVDSREAAIEAAVAAVQRIATDIDDSTLKSPIHGRALYRLAEPGEVLSAGGKVVTVLELTDVYMTIFLPTEQAGRLTVGSEARIVLDAAPDLVIPASVSFVAAQSQFTPKTVETRTEREKLMFRVKVKVDQALLIRHRERVKTGLPGVAYVRLDLRATWPEHLHIKLTR
jgi:HlyD family secretion protein